MTSKTSDKEILTLLWNTFECQHTHELQAFKVVQLFGRSYIYWMWYACAYCEAKCKRIMQIIAESEYCSLSLLCHASQQSGSTVMSPFS